MGIKLRFSPSQVQLEIVSKNADRSGLPQVRSHQPFSFTVTPMMGRVYLPLSKKVSLALW